MGEIWSGIFEFSEASSAPNSDTYCAALSRDDVADGLPVAVSSLELGISAYMEIQKFQGCTLASASGLMGCNFHNLMLRGIETTSLDN